MDARDIEPRIVRVELPPDSTATHRAIHHHDNDDDTYTVALVVSVPIDAFIERQLWRVPEDYPRVIRVDAHDRMRVEIHGTTLYEVRDRLDELSKWLKVAVDRAAEARRDAYREDDQLTALVEAINQSLDGRANG